MFVSHARLLIATLWAGSLWTVGYLVAPTLFATLSDKVLAGTIAGSVFRVEAWLSVFCGFLLIVLQKWQVNAGDRRQRYIWLGLIGSMLACTLLGYFVLQPFMAALRETAGPGGVMMSEAKAQFGVLHGMSSTFYLIESLLAAVLVLKARSQ